MKEELKKLLGKINNGVDWSIGELPDVAKQILRWGIWQNIFTIIIGIIILIPGIFFTKLGYVWEAPRTYSWNWYIIGGVPLTITGIIVILLGLYCLARVLIAPKTYLIERIRYIIK